MKPFLFAVLAGAAITLSACGGQSSPGAQPGATATVTVTQTPAPAGVSGSAAVPAVSQSAAAAPGCIGRYLNITATTSGAAAGSTYGTLVFKNLNNAPCTLYGFPGVAQAIGKPLADVGQPSSEDTASSRELVTLAPGGYGYVTLQVADAYNFPPSACTPVKSQWLNVIPPNQTAPLPVSFASTACKGAAKLLTVTAVRPGKGS
jgi:hypothetical protein